MPDRSRNREVARRMIEEWNRRGEAHLVDEMTARAVVTHFTRPPSRRRSRWIWWTPRSTRAPFEVALPREAFPDQRFEEEMIITEGDLAFIAWTVTGTHQGELYGRAPTGRQVTVHGADVIRLNDAGEITEHWDYYAKARTHALARLGLMDGDMRRRLVDEGLLGRGPAYRLGR